MTLLDWVMLDFTLAVITLIDRLDLLSTQILGFASRKFRSLCLWACRSCVDCMKSVGLVLGLLIVTLMIFTKVESVH